MDLHENRFFEKAADILSELKFNEEDLKIISPFIEEIKQGEGLFQIISELNLEDMDKTDICFRKLVELINDPSKKEGIQNFFALLQNHKPLFDTIQTLMIGKLKNSLGITGDFPTEIR